MNILPKISILVGWVTLILTFILCISLIPLDISLTNFLFSGLLRGLIEFNTNFTNPKNRIHVLRSYYTISCLRHMCQSFPLNVLLLALAIIVCLSHRIDGYHIVLTHMVLVSSIKRYLLRVF